MLLLVASAHEPPLRGQTQTPAANTFRVFLRGSETGLEEVTLLESPDGWTLRGSRGATLRTA